MAITEAEVRVVAQLARLELEDEELAATATELSKILKYVESLNELDTDNIPKTLQVALDRAPLRPDVASPSLPLAAFSSESPRTSEQGFLVPGFVDEG